MTAVLAGLLITSISTQPGAQTCGLILMILGAAWMLLRHIEGRRS